MSAKKIYILLLFLFLVLLIRLFVYFDNIKKYPQGSFITWQTNVTTAVKLDARGQKVTVELPNSQRVTLRLKLLPQVLYGDEIVVRGKLNYFSTTNGDRIAYMNYPDFKIIKEGSSNTLIKFREKIIYFFNSNLPQTYSSLMLGIVFGIKEEMPTNFYLDLQKTGLTHVIAASGMNITMLGGFLVLIFAAFLKRQIAILFTICGIILYALLAGLEPSIVRASIMGIIVLLAQLLGRQGNSFLALFFAAFIMLMRSPYLVFDIGFQLSFLATFGLIYLRPLVSTFLRFKKIGERTFIFEDLATTLTAQLMTLPILLINFGSYSLWSIPVNAIVLWTVPILMIIGGASVLVGFLFEPLGSLILYLSIPFLLYFTKIVEFFGKFGGQIEIKSLPIFLIGGYYFLILSIIWLYKNKKDNSGE